MQNEGSVDVRSTYKYRVPRQLSLSRTVTQEIAESRRIGLITVPGTE